MFIVDFIGLFRLRIYYITRNAKKRTVVILLLGYYSRCGSALDSLSSESNTVGFGLPAEKANIELDQLSRAQNSSSNMIS